MPRTYLTHVLQLGNVEFCHGWVVDAERRAGREGTEGRGGSAEARRSAATGCGPRA